MKKILSNVGLVTCCVFFTAVYSQSKAQSRTITGHVTHHDQPLSGVTVSQEGSDEIAVTNDSGVFSLVITGNNPTVIFRHPEFAEIRVSTEGKTTVAVSLTEKIKAIEEVVLNAGYYNVKAKESTGSIAKVSAKDIENQPVNNVLSAVQGRMAGVSITTNTGNAGGGFDIAIRGQNSLRFDGNAPLIIVNGIPLSANSNSVLGLSTGSLTKGEASPLNALNPNDIESIEVLKDADATAIYGSRGANGVVLVTTKKGSSKGLTTDLTLSTSFSHVNRFMKLASTDQYKKMREDAFRLDGVSSYPANANDLNGKWDNGRFTDFYETFLGKVFMNQQQEIAVSGGDAEKQMRLSLFNSERGTAYGNDFRYQRKGFSLTSGLSSKDGRLKIMPSVYYTVEKNNLAAADLTQKIFLPPNAPALYLPNGSLNWQNNTFENPLAQLENHYTAKTKSFSPRLLAEYRVFPEITARINVGYSQTLLEEFKTSPSTQYNPAYGTTAQFFSIIAGTTSHENWTVEPQLNWEKKWSAHRISALAGMTLEDRKTDVLSIQGSNFSSNELLYNLANANVQKVLADNEIAYRYLAFYARGNYTLKDRYILNVTARRDGSSRFGANERFANFGAGGAAWIFSKEDFLKDRSWLSFGKLRGSYGITGNDQIGDYQYLNTYTVNTQSYDGTTGLYPSRLFNPHFTWEKTAKLEAALELGLFKETFHLTTAWYRNRSSNQLVGIPLAATTGFATMQQNFPATVQNTGLEIDLNVEALRRKDLKWSIQGNISFPKTKLVAFPGIESSSYANTYEVGESMNIRKVYEFAGVDKETGIYTFTDFNGDGVINIDDRKKVTDFGIQFFGGIGNSFRYQNISLQFFWQFVKQKQLDTLYSLTVPGLMFNVPEYMLDYWTPENPTAQYQRPTSGRNTNAVRAFEQYRNSDAAVLDASFIRLNSLQVAWRIPLSSVSGTQFEVGLHGQNLVTITSFKGLDPEVHGIYLPTMKTYSLTATLKF